MQWVSMDETKFQDMLIHQGKMDHYVYLLYSKAENHRFSTWLGLS